MIFALYFLLVFNLCWSRRRLIVTRETNRRKLSAVMISQLMCLQHMKRSEYFDSLTTSRARHLVLADDDRSRWVRFPLANDCFVSPCRRSRSDASAEGGNGGFDVMLPIKKNFHTLFCFYLKLLLMAVCQRLSSFVRCFLWWVVLVVACATEKEIRFRASIINKRGGQVKSRFSSPLPLCCSILHLYQLHFRRLCC